MNQWLIIRDKCNYAFKQPGRPTNQDELLEFMKNFIQSKRSTVTQSSDIEEDDHREQELLIGPSSNEDLNNSKSSSVWDFDGDSVEKVDQDFETSNNLERTVEKPTQPDDGCNQVISDAFSKIPNYA